MAGIADRVVNAPVSELGEPWEACGRAVDRPSPAALDRHIDQLGIEKAKIPRYLGGLPRRIVELGTDMRIVGEGTSAASEIDAAVRRDPAVVQHQSRVAAAGAVEQAVLLDEVRDRRGDHNVAGDYHHG